MKLGTGTKLWFVSQMGPLASFLNNPAAGSITWNWERICCTSEW